MTSSQPSETSEGVTAGARASVTAPPPQPGHDRDHRWGLGAFMLVEAVFVLSAVFISVLIDPRADPVRFILVGTIVPTIVAAGLALLITDVRGNGPKLDLNWSMSRDDLRVGFKFGLIGLVCTTIAAMLWTKIVGEDNATSAIGSLVADQSLPVAAAIVLFLYVWLLGPICEEIIYRGLLWGALERMKWGRWTVFVLSTIVFAASHLEPLRTSLLLVIGVPIGLARLFTGRLGASIVAHQVNNFLPALTMLLIALGVMSQ